MSGHIDYQQLTRWYRHRQYRDFVILAPWLDVIGFRVIVIMSEQIDLICDRLAFFDVLQEFPAVRLDLVDL